MEPSARAALYQTLDASKPEIRLLRILQSTDNGTVLHCNLTTVTLGDSVPDYHALSYEWGPPDPLEVNSVLVNSHRTVITLNLWLALNHLPKNQYYWIDFLCINQGDLDERALQVAMMTRIYNMATTVEIWLGPADDLSRKGFELLRDYEILEVQSGSYRRDVTALWLPSKEDLWEGICHILKNTYWTRTWIIQEIIVAKSHEGALLRIGNQSGRFLNLYMLVSDAQLAADSLRDSVLPEARLLVETARKLHGLSLIHYWITVQCHGWNGREPEIDLDLAFLLHCYSKQKCEDPRDHVYALLGFSTKRDGLDLEINYKISVEQVYINTAVYIIGVSGKLDFLTLVQPDNVDRRFLPTWTPDWRIYNRTNQIVAFDKNDWNSSAQMAASYRFSPCGRTLYAIGMKIGTVSHLEPRNVARDQVLYNEIHAWDHDTGKDFLLDRLKFARSILENSPDVSTRLPEEATLSAFYEVNFLAYRNASVVQKLVPFPVFLKFCMELSHLISIHSPFYPLYLRNFLRRPNQMFGMTITQNRAATNLIQIPRTSNVASDENSIGLGPLDTQLGDIVVVLRGCKHPMLLRKAPQGLWVVGEVCVAGFMDGQAVGRFDSEEFELV